MNIIINIFFYFFISRLNFEIYKINLFQLRRYVGNLVEWKLSEDEVEAFQQKALEIRKKAEHIYNKFKALFTIAEGQSFWIYFSDQVDQFKDVTKNMSENEFFSLITDPTTGMNILL